MKVGDLVMMTKYHYWGIGIILAIDDEASAYIHWSDGKGCWRYNSDLEVL
jgi:hypothetical protein